jgi:SOS response regulatory protein OraA/RecX
MLNSKQDIQYLSKVDVMQAVIRLLANREHSKTELYSKLIKRYPEPELLVQVIDGVNSNVLKVTSLIRE